MNSRIAFAFARSARVQFLWRLKWWDANYVPVNSERTWRIHPNDEWMQYGPVSSRVRAAALSQPFDDTLLTQYGVELGAELSGIYPRDFNDEKHIRLMLLFMAEALADIGL